MSANQFNIKKGIQRIPFFMIKLAIFTFLAPSLTWAVPTTKFTPALKNAMVYVSEMRFKEAQKLIDQERARDAENRVPDYLEGARLCIQLFLNEDQNSLKRQQNRLDEIISRLEGLPEEDAYRNLFLGEIFVAQAILNGKFKNNLTAAWQFYRAYQLLTKNFEEYPQFTPNYIPLGVLYCAIGSLPEDYRKLASLLGFEGNVTKGMRLLQTAFFSLNKDPGMDFYSNYAGFVYSFVSFQLNPSSAISPRSLNLRLTTSSFLLYLQARISYENGNVKEATHWLDRRPKGENYANFYHLDYLQGKYLMGLEPQRAIGHLEFYLRESPTLLYRKSSYRYLSWIYLLQGDQSRSEEMRLKVLSSGNEITGADQQAQLEARKGWNLTLVKARVYFDAAQLKEALLVLEQNKIESCCPDPDDRVEYFYRLGRIEQERGNLENAKQNFKQALGVNNVPDSYALGNSALQLGVIAELAQDKTTSAAFYKKAMQYSQYPFYEGIHQKAKAGLSRLN